MKHLIKLIKDIKLRCSCPGKVPYTNDLRNRLQSLTSEEQFSIGVFICTQEYDIGTGRILALLEELGIFSVQHYINTIENPDLRTQIYNDFLENQPMLFAELVKASYQRLVYDSFELGATLELFIEDFVKDLEGLNTNPFKAVFGKLNWYPRAKQNLIDMLLRGLIRRRELDEDFLEKALLEQHLWPNELGNDMKEQIIKDCFGQMASEEDLVSFIYKIGKVVGGFGIDWQIYCQVLSLMARMYGSKILPLFRKVLNEDFKVFVKGKNEHLLFIMLIIMRQLSLASPNDFNYADWYKKTIGEMYYTVSKDEFKYVIKVLTKMVNHEGNKDFLTTHINTRIQAPTLCNDIVITYKAILRSRLESLGKKTEIIELDL